jgi:hypothetical protein
MSGALRLQVVHFELSVACRAPAGRPWAGATFTGFLRVGH